MIKRLVLLFLLSCVSSLAFGQGACYPAGVVLLDTGRPANGATVSVCTAGGTFPGCTSTTSLFTTPALSVGASNPVTTDTHGNFGFCAAAGVNYDLQITGTGITPLTIKNLPLPPTSPITAASLTSSSANPANVGQIKLATGDCLDWRNNANTGNIQLCKNTSDQLDVSAFPGIVGATLVTPNIGVATATSVNKVTITQPATGATLTVPDGTAQTFPSTSQTLVGRTSTDTLGGKTLTGAATGNNVSVLNAQGAVGPLTGNSADQVVYTYTLPANTIDTNTKSLSVRCALVHTSGTANVVVKINTNGVNVVTGQTGALASQSVSLETELLRTGTTTGGNFGISPNSAITSDGLAPFSTSVAGLAWTSNQTVTCTFNVANTDTVSGIMFIVKQNQ
jgi:hypothetical protein